MHKNRSQSSLQQQRDSVRENLRQHRAVDFFNVLTGRQLLDSTEAHLPEHRERLYPPTVVCWFPDYLTSRFADYSLALIV